MSTGGSGWGLQQVLLGEGFTTLQEGGVGAFQWQLHANRGAPCRQQWQLCATDSGQLPKRFLEGGSPVEGFTALQEDEVGAF